MQTLAEAGPLAIAQALIDRECSFYADQLLEPRLLALGGLAAPLESAEFVFAEATPELPARLFPGDPAYPDRGATLIAPARIGQGASLRLSGPGIKGKRTVALGGIPAAFWSARARALHYPLGFDMFVLDGARLIGLPRTTEIEVL
ncbi:MAG: phosphonate C-P lyase system protein PhnH [Alphaproteobacteria bacterium HGW-Alphaproteobacteria-10]|nr:MAG: phosphonate C-P lyase system protein PhnH [Alphaproteobacteria bacterium HGW-Alphaproteobacteria-10]